MKTIKLSALALIAFFSIAISSCNEEEVTPLGIPNPAASSIAAQFTAFPDYSILKQALVKTDLLTTLTEPGEYTIFAPKNAAFTAFLTANSYANIDAVPTAALKQILLYHVLPGRKSSDNIELPKGYYNTLANAPSSNNPLSLYVFKSSGTSVPKINGTVNVPLVANINASNGVIIVVDKVIALPTVVSMLSANPTLSKLVTLATDGTQADVVTALTKTDSKTVFAPTNDAFDTALAVGGFLNGNVTQPNVNSVLKYHVTAGSQKASTLTNGLIVNTFLSMPTLKTFKISNVGGVVKIIDAANLPGTKAVTTADITCTDGIIHIIDGVLNPIL